jgi:hypothetical protein
MSGRKGDPLMNPNTMELHTLQDGEPVPEGFQELPPSLNRAARRKLAGQESAIVSPTSGGKLSKWAASQRKARKTSRQSRRINRGR